MIRKFLFTTALMVLAILTAQGRNINIHGSVTVKGSNESASGVTIFNAATNKLLGMTDDDGHYSITADSESELLFSSMSYEDLIEKVNGRLQINVSLVPDATELTEIVVTAKGGKAALVVEPTDLDVEGNMLRIKTKVKIPAKKFNSSVRMIIQPAIYNVTRKHVSYLTPVVFDGWRYAVTQERMYDWDKTLDSLTVYQQIKRTPRGSENTIHLVDSLYIENPKDDYMGIIMSSLENYNNIIYADTFDIARGTVNPLRFLSYSITPMIMDEEQYLPSPEVELRDASGEMNLLFPVGKSNLDLSLGNNAAELNTMISELKAIENDPDMTLKSLSIFGSASPEGRYELNKNLAEARMKSAMETVLANLDVSLRHNVDISTHANVTSWDEVVDMLRADGHDDEAEQIQNILNRSTSPDNRSNAISRLPFYKSMLVPTYLPRLRRVNYQITSSRYRPLTDEEIAALYAANPAGLTKYQYYRLYSSLQGDAREKVLRQSLSTYPEFIVAATDLSEVMLARDENPYEMLTPFYSDPKKWNKLPISLRHNMGVAAMNEMRFSLADSLLTPLPDTPKTHKAKIYAAAQNGRYRDVIQEINEDSPLNEVLLLLAIKDNKNALEKSRQLGDSAIEEYVKAVAANRVDNYVEAITHLEQAFSLDPSLREIAKIDGDVVDLLDEDDNEDTNDNND